MSNLNLRILCIESDSISSEGHMFMPQLCFVLWLGVWKNLLFPVRP